MPHDNDHARSEMLYTSDWVSLGLWHCPPESTRWSTENNIGDKPVIALPWTSVIIDRPESRHALVNPNSAVFYDAGEPYHRQLASDRGDECAFINPSEEMVREIHEELGVITSGSLFAWRVGPSDTWCSAAHHALAKAVKDGQVTDPLYIEEQLTHMVSRTLRTTANVMRRRQKRGRPATRAAHRELARNAIEVITQSVLAPQNTERLGIREIADRVHTSAYHLCRVFKAETGETLAGYHMRLRLAVAAEPIVWTSIPVTEIAHRMAFSSHAHFTTAWKAAYGAPPSTFRQGPAPIPNAYPRSTSS